MERKKIKKCSGKKEIAGCLGQMQEDKLYLFGTKFIA